MAHTITGIDLGTSAVKFAVVELGFRHERPLPLFEVPIPEGEAPFADRQLIALQEGLQKLPSGTTVYIAFPGESATLRVLELPFADARKIDQVVGFEMEGLMVHDLADVTLDHRVLSAHGQKELESGCRALVLAARNDAIAGFLAGLQSCGIEPRSVPIAPLVYAPLLPPYQSTEGSIDTPVARLVVDLGMRKTQLCFVVGNETVFGRTLFRGGDEITQAFIAASQGAWDYAKAEESKKQFGFVGSRLRPAESSVEIRVDGIIRKALEPLVRDLRQTLASYSLHDKAVVMEILLTGGGSRLPGLTGFLADELGITVRLLIEPPLVDPDIESDPIEFESDRFALANALVAMGVRGGRHLDLRRGAFQYRASLSIVREKAVHLVLLALALVLCGGAWATMSLRRLTAEGAVLQAQLSTATKELFGDTRMEATDVTAALKRSFRDEMAPLPKATAYDLLDEISRRMPAADKVKVDIEDLDIRPKKTSIKGTVDSAAAVDEIVSQLKQIECFEEINKGPVTEVSGGAKQFSLAIVTKCP
jgi:Tfp pilus assembly PilM family ATPase